MGEGVVQKKAERASTKMKESGKFPSARMVQISIDAGLILLSLFLSCVFTEQKWLISSARLSWFFQTAFLFLFVKLSINYWFRIYRQLWRYVSIKDVVNIFKACTLSSLVGIACMFVFKWQTIGRTMLVLDWILCIGLFSGARFLRRYLTMRKLEERRPLIKKKKVLLYGAGENGELILRRIQSDPYLKLHAVCFVDDDSEKRGAVLHGVEIMGDIERMGDLIDRLDVEEIIITAPLIPKEKIEKTFQISKRKNIEVKIAPSFYGMFQTETKAPLAREIDVQDLLGRQRIIPNIDFLMRAVSGKRILVTGGCGSIGKELVKQSARFAPEKIIVLDNNETGIFWLDYDLSQSLSKDRYALFLGDVRNPEKLKKIIDEERPEVIYHAAAYKHVPLSLSNPSEYITTNVYGTKNILELVKTRPFVKRFCLISTDKAANPSSVMGATKRLAEMIVLREAVDSEEKKITFVRFGNVLGSRGSVVPIFRDMIAKGGPVKVTHLDVERYFMDIREAVHLVLQAPFFVGSGKAFLLDMGKSIKINDLAKLVIKLAGFDERSMKIEYVGLRPGEKVVEELFDPAHEELKKTSFHKIFSLLEKGADPGVSDLRMQGVIATAQKGDDEGVRHFLKEVFPNVVVR